MKPILASVALTLAFAAPAAAATCRLVADGATVIDGPCRFEAMEDGSFTVHSPDDAWFAYVLLDGPQTAEGYWNGERGATHAHASLGTLTRDKGCWSNAASEVCAWE